MLCFRALVISNNRTATANMDMSMSGMDMGSSEGGDDDMSNGVSFHALQRYYWAVMGAAIGLAALANVFNKLLARQR